MAAVYYTNAAGEYIRYDPDETGEVYMTGEPEDCCCEDCCAEPGGPPTAAFTWTHDNTDAGTCQVDLVNQSTQGTCGNIVAYSWLKNGVLFSTSSNPTNVSVSDGDIIKLIATDTAGCTGEVEHEITCAGDCCGGEVMPSQVVLDLATNSNVSENAGADDCTGDECLLLNSLHTLDYVGGSGNNCLWRKTGSIATCNASSGISYEMEVTVNKLTAFGHPVFANGTQYRRVTAFYRIQYISGSAGFMRPLFIKEDSWSSVLTCRGTITVPYDSDGDNGAPHPCARNGTVSAVVII